jgi:hypothetical protein
LRIRPVKFPEDVFEAPEPESPGHLFKNGVDVRAAVYVLLTVGGAEPAVGRSSELPAQIVVLAALGRAGEDGIGFIDPLHGFRRPAHAGVAVGVVLECQPPIGRFDLPG